MLKLGLEDLTQLEILQGSTSLIYAITGTIIGLIIASKYLTYERKELLGIGISLSLLQHHGTEGVSHS